jgi:hypothetical protein
LEGCCFEREAALVAIKGQAESLKRDMNKLFNPVDKLTRNFSLEKKESENEHGKLSSISDRVYEIKLAVGELQNLKIARAELDNYKAIVDDMNVRTISKRISYESDWGKYTSHLENNAKIREDLVKLTDVTNVLDYERR